MSEEDYYLAIKSLGLDFSGEKTDLIEVWVDADGTDWGVPNPAELSAEDRAETIDRFKKYMGIGVTFGPH